MKTTVAGLLTVMALGAASASAQVLITGRIWAPKTPRDVAALPPDNGVVVDYFTDAHRGQPAEVQPMSNVRCFGNTLGSDMQAVGSGSWEMAPSGWFYLNGGAGNYTLLFTGPGNMVRPVVYTNVFTEPGRTYDIKVVPNFDYASFDLTAWDEKPASHYYQTFTARGTSITRAGFKLASDGVDGIGPGVQVLLLSIHEAGAGTPDTWKQVGPTGKVLNVDSGGPKNYDWSCAWNSGEVPTTPGRKYAVHLASETGTPFQAFWRVDDDKATDVYRLGEKGATGWVGRDLYMNVSSDSDGLLVPYNKRIQREYGEFAGGGQRWAQTYVAQGRGLAGVLLYAAASGNQPSMNRQRIRFSVREDGPEGKPVGIAKIGIGNGNYTGDASWGTYGAVFAPGEVNLQPGNTYAVVMETIETYASLSDFKNIKGVPSDNRPMFNPYRKFVPDDYAEGTAFKDGKDAGFDLDMQIIEYAHGADNWAHAVDDKNLLVNGDMEAGELVADQADKGKPQAWTPFAVDEGTTHLYLADEPDKTSRILRVVGGALSGKTCDGGYAQRVEGLSRRHTYRLFGQVRSSFPVDREHYCAVGIDPTGQTDDPKAETIVWTKLPGISGIFVDHASEPVRPEKDAVSVWLRAWTSDAKGFPFKADFDNFALRQVKDGVPIGE